MVTSTLGMIHMGNKSQAEEILNPYFAGAAGGGQDGGNSPYSTAGAYYAYGLIHANQFSQATSTFLEDGYRNSG